MTTLCDFVIIDSELLAWVCASQNVNDIETLPLPFTPSRPVSFIRPGLTQDHRLDSPVAIRGQCFPGFPALTRKPVQRYAVDMVH